MESVRVQKRSSSVLSMFLKLGTSFRNANDVRNDVRSYENKSVDNFMKMGRHRTSLGRHFAANDVLKNGLIARVQGNRTSYCYEIDKKVRIL
jgi:hypothetical protein